MSLLSLPEHCLLDIIQHCIEGEIKLKVNPFRLRLINRVSCNPYPVTKLADQSRSLE
jgi:hypothetical protein